VELRRIIWAWDTVVLRLDATVPELGRPLRRATRPIAAERHADGRLLVVLGCWVAADLARLSAPDATARLAELLAPMLEDDVRVRVVAWPAGLVTAPPGAADVAAPDVLDGLPTAAREPARACESALQRWFYAHAYRQGIRLHCQYVVGHYRLDFAVPRYRIGAEVLGWELRHGPRERERFYGAERWRVIWFAGEEVHADVERCVAALRRLLPREGGPPGLRRAPAHAPVRPRRNGYRERR
jgi:very-short-patch-repair endonuclease